MIERIKECLSKEMDNIFLWMPFLMGLGIIYFFNLSYDPNPKTAIICSVLSGVLVLLCRKSYAPFIISVGIFCLVLGYSAAQYRAVSLLSPKLLEKLDDIWIEGNVSEVTYYDDGQRIILENIYTDHLLKNEAPKRIRINTRSDISSVQIGDRVLVRASIMPPPDPIVPGGFDFAYYLYFKEIGAIGFATSKVSILDDENRLNSFWFYVNKLRRNIAEKISNNMQLPYSAIANGMMVGDASQINKNDFEIIRVSGIAHIIAISGMHIVTVVGMVFFAVRFLLIRFGDLALRLNVKKVSAAIAIFVSLVYLLISGSPVSAQRAFVMSTLVLLAIILDRSSTPMRSIAISAIIILLLTPEAILGASLQMSFAACVALIASFEISKNFFAKKFGQSFLSKAGVYICSVTFSTLVAGTATAPFIIYHFNQFSTYSVLSNIVCVPLSDFIIMPLGMISMLLMPFGLEIITLMPMEWGLKCMFQYAKYISELPNASFYIPSFTNLGIGAIAFGGLILCFFTTNLRYLGVPVLCVGVLTINNFNPPTIAIDKSAKFFAIKEDNGEMLFSTKKISKFTKSAWMQNLGINEFKLLNVEERCKKGKCELQLNNRNVAIFLKDSTPECSNANITINLSETLLNCDAYSKVINANDIKKSGSHLIWLEHGGIKVKTVLDERAKRIWNS